MWVTGNHSFILTILLVNQISAKNNLMGREKVTPNNTKRKSVLGLSIQLNWGYLFLTVCEIAI